MCAACRSHFSKIASTSASRPRLDDEQHALLRFGEHDLVRRHAGLALRHVLTSISMPTPPRAPISQVEQVRPAAPMSCTPISASVCHQLEARLEQQLLHERIADLHRRPLLRRLLVELRRRHRRAVDAVAAGPGADVVDGVAEPAGLALDERVGLGDAEAEHVDQRVAGVAALEHDLAADGRDADAVAVAGDAARPRLRRCGGCAPRRARPAVRSAAS